MKMKEAAKTAVRCIESAMRADSVEGALRADPRVESARRTARVHRALDGENFAFHLVDLAVDGERFVGVYETETWFVGVYADEAEARAAVRSIL